MSEMSRHGGTEYWLQSYGVCASNVIYMSSASHYITAVSADTNFAMCVEQSGKCVVATNGKNDDYTKEPSRSLIGRLQDRFQYGSDNLVFKTCARIWCKITIVLIQVDSDELSRLVDSPFAARCAWIDIGYSFCGAEHVM